MLLHQTNTLSKLGSRLYYSKISAMAKDLFHDAVEQALLKKQWVITADPLTLKLANWYHYPPGYPRTTKKVNLIP